MHYQIHAVAGLGNPGRFFDLLDKLGFDSIRHPFPDHHNFSSSDIFYLDHLPIVMTEKDASKCKDFDNNKIWYLTIDADVTNIFIDKLDKKLDKHIQDIWTVYEPIKKILEKLERFKLW